VILGVLGLQGLLLDLAIIGGAALALIIVLGVVIGVRIARR
jgi:hypothetical protein